MRNHRGQGSGHDCQCLTPASARPQEWKQPAVRRPAAQAPSRFQGNRWERRACLLSAVDQASLTHLLPGLSLLPASLRHHDVEPAAPGLRLARLLLVTGLRRLQGSQSQQSQLSSVSDGRLSPSRRLATPWMVYTLPLLQLLLIPTRFHTDRPPATSVVPALCQPYVSPCLFPPAALSLSAPVTTSVLILALPQSNANPPFRRLSRRPWDETRVQNNNAHSSVPLPWRHGDLATPEPVCRDDA